MHRFLESTLNFLSVLPRKDAGKDMVDSLVLGIMSYITVQCVQGNPILCAHFYPILIFHIVIRRIFKSFLITIPNRLIILVQEFFIYLSPLGFNPNLLIILVQVSSSATSSQTKYIIGSLDYSCTCT